MPSIQSQPLDRPQIIVLSGPPCSGKTTFAEDLSARMGYPHLQMDEILKTIIPESKHTKKDRNIAYKAMHLLAGYLLQSGITIIVDATYGPLEQRSQLESIALKTQARMFLIECKINPDIAVERFNTRRNEHPAIDLSPRRVRSLAMNFPYFGRGLTIDALDNIEECLHKINHYILHGEPIQLDGEWSQIAINPH